MSFFNSTRKFKLEQYATLFKTQKQHIVCIFIVYFVMKKLLVKNILFNLLVTALFISTVNIYGQHVNSAFFNNQTFKKGELDSNYKNLIGTIYIDNNFKPALISLVNKTYPTRYDAYHDEMEIEENKQQYYLPKTFDCNVLFQDKIYGVFNHNDENGFFNILVSGKKLNLLIKEKIKLNQEIEGNGIRSYVPPALKRLKDQLFISNNNEASKLPENKKEFYNLFSSNSKEIERYVKDRQLSIKDQSDLIKIFEYYNTL